MEKRMKYIDLLTIGSFDPTSLSMLQDFRLNFNVVSCRTNNIELFEFSKYVLEICQNKEEFKFIDNLENTEITVNRNDLFKIISSKLSNLRINRNLYIDDTVYISITANSSNLNKLPFFMSDISNLNSANKVILLTLSTLEFKNKEQDINFNILRMISNYKDLKIIWSNLPYEYCKFIPALNYLKENGLEEKLIYIVDLESTYSKNVFDKTISMLNDIEDTVITLDENLPCFFGFKLMSNYLSITKAKYFSDLIFNSLDNNIINTSSSDYWHTFCLWLAKRSNGTYSSKFDINHINKNKDKLLNLKTSELYTEIARLCINGYLNK